MGSLREKTGGIRSQLTAGIVILSVAATSLMGVLTLKVAEQRIFNSRVREAELIADFFIYRSRERFDALVGIADLGRRLVESGRISGVRVVGANGEKTISGPAAINYDEGRPLFTTSDLSIRHYGGGSFGAVSGELRVSAKLKDSARLGFVFPLTGIAEELAGIKRFIFYFAAAASSIIIAIGAYTLSRLVVAPIRRLEQAAKSIAAGNFSERARVEGKDELSSLAGSFNAMAVSIEEKIGHIEAVNRELVAAQERLIITEKLATAGTLAAGIAHEIGNPLGAVQGYLDILRKGGVEGGEAAEILERMDKELSRINGIVRDFLDISRPRREHPVPVDVNRLATESAAIVRAHRDFAGVSVAFNLADLLPMVVIDEGMLKQVFINILLNAAEAMAGAGSVTIATRAAESGEYGFLGGRRKTDRPAISVGTAGGDGTAMMKRKVVISFSDTGPGVSDDERKRIFDPFYTTKETGKGTGLGLFVSEGIVEAYGGRIVLKNDSKGGRGATFEVVLEAAG
jgi:signal transduction histidine kinase